MTKDVYIEHGYKDRQDYLQSLSEEYDVDMETVEALAYALGDYEDFDGLVAMLEDYCLPF